MINMWNFMSVFLGYAYKLNTFNSLDNEYKTQIIIFKVGIMKFPWLYIWDETSICLKKNHNPVLSSFITYYRVCNNSNTMSATSRAGRSCPSGALEFMPHFSGVRLVRSLVFCVVLCRPLSFFHFCLFTPTDYHFDILKHLASLITTTKLAYLRGCIRMLPMTCKDNRRQ